MKKGWSRKRVSLIGLGIFFVLVFFVLWFFTGFVQSGNINNRDLGNWDYGEDGVIVGGEAFVLDGDSETCWYLIHGYTSTAAEMRELAEKVNGEFGDKVFVARLKGSGEVPSHILDLTLYDWYDQVLGEFDLISEECGKVNLVGFSFGGALSARISEERDVNNLYLIAPYLVATHRWYFGFRAESYLDWLGDSFVYVRKGKAGQINWPEGLENHVAYLNMPLGPVKHSKEFFEDVKKDVGDIDVPVLLQHSSGDQTSSMESSEFIYDGVSSEVKELVVFERSNHILLADYDKDAVGLNIVGFEKGTRD